MSIEKQKIPDAHLARGDFSDLTLRISRYDSQSSDPLITVPSCYGSAVVSQPAVNLQQLFAAVRARPVNCMVVALPMPRENRPHRAGQGLNPVGSTRMDGSEITPQ
jgi:hypothetical protein